MSMHVIRTPQDYCVLFLWGRISTDYELHTISGNYMALRVIQDIWGGYQVTCTKYDSTLTSPLSDKMSCDEFCEWFKHWGELWTGYSKEVGGMKRVKEGGMRGFSKAVFAALEEEWKS